MSRFFALIEGAKKYFRGLCTELAQKVAKKKTKIKLILLAKVILNDILHEKCIK